MDTNTLKKEFIDLAEKIREKYALEDDIDEITSRVKIAVEDKTPLFSFEDLAEYFEAVLEEKGIMTTFDEMLTLANIFADENAQFCNIPKAYTYARYIAGLITSIADENDQARAIGFLENPEMPFTEWIQ